MQAIALLWFWSFCFVLGQIVASATQSRRTKAPQRKTAVTGAATAGREWVRVRHERTVAQPFGKLTQVNATGLARDCRSLA
jgi:hypothetical protein